MEKERQYEWIMFKKQNGGYNVEPIDGIAKSKALISAQNSEALRGVLQEFGTKVDTTNS